MLKIGDKVSPSEVMLQDGSLVQFPELGKKYILFFYPKDNTKGCTEEACSFRDSYRELSKKGYSLYGVSIDSHKKHQSFIKKNNLSFPLIADIEKKLVEQFGVWGKKKFMGREYMGIFRTTFIIDETSSITHIIDKVDTKKAAEQVLELI